MYCSNGPLLWAIITWRNSLVFHDLDKITSVMIHAFPPIGIKSLTLANAKSDFCHSMVSRI